MPTKYLNTFSIMNNKSNTSIYRRVTSVGVLLQRLVRLRVGFNNMRKLFPGSQCYDSWRPRFTLLWSGKLWYLELRGYTLVFDWRGGPDAVLRDLSA